MTPRRIVSWLILARKRQKREQAAKLAFAALAGRGDPKELKKQMDQLLAP